MEVKNMEINKVKQKIQELITQNDKDYKEIKDRYTFLYKRLEEVKELETISRLKKFKDGEAYLNAYLMYKSIVRANYQIEHLNLTNFDKDEQGQFRVLETIQKDIDNVFEEVEVCPACPNEQPTNEELLKMLGERIATKEIKGQVCDYDDGYMALYIGNQPERSKDGDNYLLKDYEMKVSLFDGEIKYKNKESELATDKIEQIELGREEEDKHE